MEYFLINLNKNSNFETSFIKNKLLKKVVYEEINFIDLNKYEINNNLIVIYSGGDNHQIDKLKSIASQTGIYLLIHLSDETLQHDLSYYSYAKKVIRNYYNPFLIDKNIITLPIGYKNATERDKSEFITISSRKYKWSFVGSMKNDRYKMIKKFSHLKQNFTHVTDSFFSSDHLKPKEYKEILNNSIFVLCPRGYSNFESFRILESLENFTIPIFKRELFFDHLKPIYGQHIFLNSYTWKGLAKKVSTYLNNEQQLEIYFNELMKWYDEYIELLSINVEEFITTNKVFDKKEKKISNQIYKISFKISQINFRIQNLITIMILKLKKFVKRKISK